MWWKTRGIEEKSKFRENCISRNHLHKPLRSQKPERDTNKEREREENMCGVENNNMAAE